MEKILLIGDCHLGITPYKLIEKRKDTFNIFKHILEKFANDVDWVILMGDLFHVVDLETIEVASIIKNYADKILFLKGNHDEDVDKFYRIFGIEKKEIVKIGKFDFVLIDWKRDHNEIRKIINLIKDKQKTVLCLHANIKELIPALKRLEDFLYIKELKDFRLVFNGHIHNYYRQGNFINIGSIDRWDITNQEERRIFILEVDDDIRIKEMIYATRIIAKVDKKEDLRKIVAESIKPPIIFYKNIDLTPQEILYYREKCLLFEVKPIETEIEELQRIDVDVLSREKLFSVLKNYIENKDIDVRVKEIFLNCYPDSKKAEIMLKEVFNVNQESRT